MRKMLLAAVVMCTVLSTATLMSSLSVVNAHPLPVEIDIKPYSCPNSVNLNDQGRLPVAIMGSSTLDVTDINPDTIKLGGVPPTTRGSGKPAVSYEDVYGDGYMDLVVFFKVQDLVGDGALTPATTSLTLTAHLYGTTPIQGTGSVRIVPP